MSSAEYLRIHHLNILINCIEDIGVAFDIDDEVAEEAFNSIARAGIARLLQMSSGYKLQLLVAGKPIIDGWHTLSISESMLKEWNTQTARVAFGPDEVGGCHE